TFKLTVHVADGSGAEIPDAKVSVSSAAPSSAFAPLAITTDRRGTAAVEIESGTYKVSVSRSGFMSYNQRLQIDVPLSLSVKLQIPSYHGPVLVAPVIFPLAPTSIQLRERIPE